MDETTPQDDAAVRREQKLLPRRDWDRAVCIDPDDDRRRWAYHYPLTSGPAVLNGVAQRVTCGTCGDSYLITPR